MNWGEGWNSMISNVLPFIVGLEGKLSSDDMLNRDELKRSSNLQQLMPHNIVQQSNPQQYVSGISSSESSSGN